MLPDAVELVKLLKKTAVDATDATKPANVCFGVVESANPLRIKVEQKMTLGDAQLVLCRNVTDYSVSVTTSGQTERSGEPSHAHSISGRKEITLHNALAAGEKVILLRQQGGQKYVVLDRIGGM